MSSITDQALKPFHIAFKPVDKMIQYQRDLEGQLRHVAARASDTDARFFNRAATIIQAERYVVEVPVNCMKKTCLTWKMAVLTPAVLGAAVYQYKHPEESNPKSTAILDNYRITALAVRNTPIRPF